MAVEVTTAMYISDILLAAVLGAIWVIYPLLAYFTLRATGSSFPTAASYLAKIMLMILAGYALLGAMVGFLNLTHLDNVATIIGADLQPIVQAIEAFHGAIDVDIPDMVNNFVLRDVVGVALIPMVTLISVFLSYWHGEPAVVMIGLACWIATTFGVPLYLVMRAFTVGQVIFWGIVGGVGMFAHIIAQLGYSRVDWTVKYWVVWFPMIVFFLTRVAFMTTAVISNPVVTSIPIGATTWIYPGFMTFEVLALGFLAYWTREWRFPAKGWSFYAIFYGLVEPNSKGSSTQGDIFNLD